MTRSSAETSRPASRSPFVLFWAVLFFNFADQSLLSPLLNPLLQQFFGRTSNVLPLGWLSFAFTLTSALSMLLAGFWADRASRQRICRAGLLLYGACSALVLLTPGGHRGYVVFFVLRALGGIGIGAVIPAVFSMVGDTVSARKRGLAFGGLSVALLAGRMAGFFLAGAWSGRWRLAYFVLGATNLALALVMVFVREPKRGMQEAELKDTLLRGAEYRFRLSSKDIPHLWSTRSNIWLIANFLDVIPGSIVIFLIFKYMKDKHNMEAGSVNPAVLLVMMLGILGALVFGRLGDWGFRKDGRARVAVALFCNAFPIVFMVIFLNGRFWVPEAASFGQALAVPGAAAVILSVAAAVFINQGVNPNWYGSLTDINLPEHRATMIALASLMDMVGNALGPLFAAFVATSWGLEAAMRSVLFFWAANVLLWLPVLRHIRADLARRHEVLAERAERLKRETN